MGYYIEFSKSTISISKQKSIKMMEELELHIENLKPNWAWINTDTIMVCCKERDFIRLMEELQYVIKIKNDEYVIDGFLADKLGDEIEILRIMAPFVDDGYIEMVGEDGEVIRWVFEDGKLKC